ncbi:glycosyltransferase family 9 protein [soil metagenome]
MIGDVLTSSILFEALRKKFPAAELHFLIQPHTVAVVENNPFIDRLVLFDPKKYKSTSGLLKFAKKIKKEKYDVVIDVYSKINSAVITILTGAKTRISYQKWYTSYAYTKTFELTKDPLTKAGVAIENRMLLLKGLREDFPLEIKPKIYLAESERSQAWQRLQDSGIDLKKPLFMISILGSSPAKTYPGKYMAKVLDLLVEKGDAQLIFNYNPKQELDARAILDSCGSITIKNVYLDVFGNSLREFLALTSYCDALIGNEGGAVNMAKALNIPTFSIFSPQIQKKVWAVYQDELNVAVHIDDFSEEDESIRAEGSYERFKPSLFFPLLNSFINKVKKSNPARAALSQIR